MGFVSSDGVECVCMSGKNLFHRAIVQSGSALSSWGVATRPLHYAHRLAEAVNCSTTTDHHQSTDFIACFKRLSARVLVDAPVPGAAYRYLSALGPTVDSKTVLPSAVRVLVNKNIDSVLGRTPLLVGVTSDEGQIFLSQSDVDQVLSLNVLVVSQLRPRSATALESCRPPSSDPIKTQSCSTYKVFTKKSNAETNISILKGGCVNDAA